MESPENKKEKFFPSGAIAFFIALVILSLVFWYGIYFLMIQRS
jgi:Cytochrome c oxidase subunit IIa family